MERPLRSDRLSGEFLLIASACEWPRSPARDERLRNIAAGKLDWKLFLALAKRHRVEGLAHRALAEAAVAVPDEVKAALSRAASAIGAQSLMQAAESARLQRLLKAGGTDCLFLKGVPLAALAYGTLGVKQAWDIDVLVPPEAAAAAMDLLRQSGYVRDFPGPEVPEDRLLDWAAISKETLWVHPATGMVVELHTGLVDNPWLIPGVSGRPQVQIVPIGSGIELPTLATDQLFAYLCVHGGAHAWARLKWLADVAALVRNAAGADVESFYRRSLELGAGHSSAQALLLCERLLSLPLPDSLARELRRDPVNRWLERLALSAMSAHGATELDDTLLGTVVINVSHFMIGRGWRYKYRELVRKSINPEDRFAMPLPSYLTFIYPILAVPRWLWRRYRLSRC